MPSHDQEEVQCPCQPEMWVLCPIRRLLVLLKVILVRKGEDTSLCRKGLTTFENQYVVQFGPHVLLR